MSILAILGGIAKSILGGAVVKRAVTSRVVRTIAGTGLAVGAGAVGSQLAAPGAPQPGVAGMPALPGLPGMAPRRRRRGRGFTARDIRQQRRLMKMLKDFQKLAPSARRSAPSRHHHHD